MKKFNGIKYLLIDIANTFGYDKLIWEERIDKALAIIDSITDEKGEYIKEELLKLANSADEPAHCLSALLAYKDALKCIRISMKKFRQDSVIS